MSRDYKQGTKESYSHVDSCKPYPAQDECHCSFAYGEPYELCPDCDGTGKVKRELSLYEKNVKKGNKGKEGYDYPEFGRALVQDFMDEELIVDISNRDFKVYND